MVEISGTDNEERRIREFAHHYWTFPKMLVQIDYGTITGKDSKGRNIT